MESLTFRYTLVHQGLAWSGRGALGWLLAALRLITGKPRSYRIYAMPDPVIAATL
ncbi:hypothetical protein C4K35_0736 [Pseudomonas chlororaphis subsp. piscium]|nr:hypothetical protein C4K35_0736 [Pseudomonas chlororaphis subsp. piscium]